MSLFRQSLFHLRRFAGTSYFVQLLVTSTLSVLALQYLAGRGGSVAGDQEAWLRAGIIGMWTVVTVAAGLVGFQRYQGTLVHLVMSPRPAGFNLGSMVGSAATFGLIAFPLSALVSPLFGFPIFVRSWSLVVVHVLLLWLASLAVSFVIATLFVLTPRAITYEGLLVIPVILLCGVFGYPAGAPQWLLDALVVIPLSAPIRGLREAAVTGTLNAANLMISIVVMVAWFLGASLLSRHVQRTAVRQGTLEVV